MFADLATSTLRSSRWRQFGLRSLLFFIGVVAVACGLLVWEFQRSAAVIETYQYLEGENASVTVEDDFVELLPGRYLFVHIRAVLTYGDRQWTALMAKTPRCHGFGVQVATVHLTDLVTVSRKMNGTIISLSAVQLSMESGEAIQPNKRVVELRYSQMELSSKSLQRLQTAFPNAEIFEY